MNTVQIIYIIYAILVGCFVLGVLIYELKDFVIDWIDYLTDKEYRETYKLLKAGLKEGSKYYKMKEKLEYDTHKLNKLKEELGF